MSTGLLEKREIIEANPIDSVIKYYKDSQTQFILEQFKGQVKTFFELNPKLHIQPIPAIHSIKCRLKDPEHLRDKIERKAAKGTVVTEDNLFQEVTDLIGVRILHLYQEQFVQIHSEINEKLSSGDWVLGEAPKAYTWDPKTQAFFQDLGIATAVKDSYYTMRINSRNGLKRR